MRWPAVLYLVGMGLLLVGERLIGGEDVKRWAFDGAGLAALVGAIVTLLRARAAAAEDQRAPHGAALGFAGLGMASLVLYALTTDEALRALAFTEQGEQRFRVAMTAAWMIVWLLGTVPFLTVDRALAVNPVVVPPGRVRDASAAALTMALALALVFPANYLATEHNKRWDLGYFKTAEPGSSTLAIVEGLSEPIRAVLFFPASSDVTQEVRTYFDALASGNLSVEYVDHALEPELAKELKVRENGTIAFVRGEGEDQKVETVKIGADFDAAKRNLKKLDEKVKEALVKATRGKKTAYVTVGHGEMYWKAGEPKDRMIDQLKKGLGSLQYKVKELGIASGLAQEVPDDAAFVAVLGPTQPFLPEELSALEAYLRRGGSLLLALNPDGPDMSALLGPLGLAYKNEVLASDQNVAIVTRRKMDRLNLATNKYSTHPSVTTLSRNSKTLPALMPLSGYLTEGAPVEGVKVTFTVRSLPDAWNDLNKNLDFDPPEEKREGYALVAAVSGPATPPPAGEAELAQAPTAIPAPGSPPRPPGLPDAPTGGPPLQDGPEGKPEKKDEPEGPQFRAVVFAGSTWVSDFFLPNVQGNQVLLQDTVAWLSQDEALAGTVNSEEDVKILHSKEGQGWLFYGTSFLVPLLLLTGGLLRVRLRHKRGVA